jgi:hypothetical protein
VDDAGGIAQLAAPPRFSAHRGKLLGPGLLADLTMIGGAAPAVITFATRPLTVSSRVLDDLTAARRVRRERCRTD